MTERRSWKPSARRGPTSSVRLTLAGGRAVSVTRLRSFDRAERGVERQPLVDADRLRPAVGCDASLRQRRLEARPADLRQLPRQDVVQHLAPLAETGLDEPPQRVLVLWSEP